MKYSIGLDIGTNSVGWAVVDENNQIVKKNGFALWGVRMFEEAKDASETRSHRTDRRRLARRNYRIKLLREIFNNEIYKIDNTFFERMDDSFYKLEDKRNANFSNLFNDEITDKEFYNQFPTIFHLRKHLMTSTKQEDIRFIYLALHHMIKYRGNFLYQGDTFNKGNDSRIKNIFNELNSLLIEYSTLMEDYANYFDTIQICDNFFEKFQSIMIAPITKIDKKRQLKELFKAETKSLANECIIPLLVGSKCNFSNLTPVKDEKYEKAEVVLFTENLESLLDETKGKVKELSNIIDFCLELKEVVDHYFLINLLKDGETLSDAMIKKYDEHNEDLNLLKKLIKQYLPKKYNDCFRKIDDKLNNYPHYVGYNSTNSKVDRFSHCSRDAFYTYILNLLKQITDEDAQEVIQYFNSKIENNDFLLRQNSDQNGALPMQLNLSEMIQILDNQSEYYPFLNEVDNDGISNTEKIISIFKFIVPYYVGPLNTKSTRGWIVRSEEKIYPWNFDKVVDTDETAKRFIENMQRRCTYLKGDNDYCMPKKSIIYSKYNCLSYLNKLSIDGALINNNLKNEIFENVFLKNTKPNKKMIINYIQSNYGDISLTTTKLKDLPEVNCDMASYIKFTEIFGENIDDKIDLIEQIIKDIVIFSDKSLLEKRLRNVYKLDSVIVKKIKDLNYKDYCNLSSKLINKLIVKDPNTGEIYGTVLDIMTNTNCNLQEILYLPEYRLIDVIDEYNKEKLGGKEFQTVEDFLNENVAVSPIMKRPLIQAHTIIKEVEKILNKKIDKFYVECTRTNKAEKKQTKSRYSRLKELYAYCKKMTFDINVNVSELEKKLDKYQNDLKSDMLYLYFTQLGKCMYTLEDISFESLISSNSKYDIDHIYPQALIKDDSFSNKVLVLKTKNNEKQDNLLFEMSSNFLDKRAFAFYEKLKDAELITKEKYRRLTKKELSSAELEGFVNRQIVTTNQSVKGLIQVLKMYDKVDPTNIIYSKAENISMARQLFDLPKSRLANNFHHAHDAYLNVVIGRVIDTYFKKNHFNGYTDYYRLKAENKTINVETILKFKKWNINNELVEKSEVIKLLDYNLYNRYDISETTRTYNPNELFKKVTIQPAKSGTVPIKEDDLRSNIDKYGGITSYSYCKYIIVETVNKKGKKEYILEAIPKAFDKKEEKYLLKEGYTNFKIIHNNIKTNVVIKEGPLKYSITGKMGPRYLQKNSHDRFFNKNYITIIKKIEKCIMNFADMKDLPIINEKIILSQGKNNKYGEIILSKEELVQLYDGIVKKFTNNIYSYSPIIAICKQLKTININQYDIQELIVIISELLNLLQTNSRKSADLTLINMAYNCGILSILKKLSPKMQFISESITGYYKKVLFEVPDNGI